MTTRLTHKRRGMTMIELIAALALFGVILVSLMTVLDTATNLWSPTRTQLHEQNLGDAILDILAGDLYQAVTDRGVSRQGTATNAPAFILSCDMDAVLTGAPQIIMQFARHASTRFAVRPLLTPRLSLDAVFYTYATNCLTRHVLPLDCDPENPAALGDLLDLKRIEVENLIQGGTQTATPGSQQSLLAERCIITGLTAELPIDRSRPGSNPGQRLEADVLPDHLDLAFTLYNTEDWKTLHTLESDTSETAERKREILGKRFSKRITFPSKGGSGL